MGSRGTALRDAGLSDIQLSYIARQHKRQGAPVLQHLLHRRCYVGHARHVGEHAAMRQWWCRARAGRAAGTRHHQQARRTGRHGSWWHAAAQHGALAPSHPTLTARGGAPTAAIPGAAALEKRRRAPRRPAARQGGRGWRWGVARAAATCHASRHAASGPSPCGCPLQPQLPTQNSLPAPQPKLTCPESSAASRSGSTRCPPRAALMTAAPRGSQPKSRASRMPLQQAAG